MADPRFYRNHGPFTLETVCAKLGLAPPQAGSAMIDDAAGLEGAGPSHFSFFNGAREQKAAFARSRAGFCFVPETGVADAPPNAPEGMTLLPVKSVGHAWAAAVALFYPAHEQVAWPQVAIDPTASIGAGVTLAPHVVIGAGVEIGEGTRIGPGCAIGPGVTIGRDCEIGANVTITHAHVGDQVTLLPGVRIGSPGFGFTSSGAGHMKLPQLGRVIVQDKVEIGANSTVDRGAIGDTVIGEGTKIDNLVQIAHNARTGRHCLIVSQAGMAGSAELGDFVVIAGQVGVADHVHVGSGARIAGQSGLLPHTRYEPGQDYGGMPARPLKEWVRELAAVKALVRQKKKDRP
jgi:UDP-3-O-[3-hydroxymyristoyl] glucosamine N-acyltransferase